MFWYLMPGFSLNVSVLPPSACSNDWVAHEGTHLMDVGSFGSSSAEYNSFG